MINRWINKNKNSIVLYTHLWSFDLLRKGAMAVKCKMSSVRWSRGVLVCVPRYFIPLCRTQCIVVVVVCLEIAINLQTDCRSILPLIFHPSWLMGMWCWQGQPWLVSLFPFLDIQTQHNTVICTIQPGSLTETFLKGLIWPSRRGLADTIRNQTLGTMLKPVKKNTRRLAT